MEKEKYGRRYSNERWNLKPCPFCGGFAFLEETQRAFVNGQTERVAFVRCVSCNARSSRFRLADFGKTSYSIQACIKAVEAWNKRNVDLHQEDEK